MKLLKPRRLEPGHTIGVVAPSSLPREPSEIDVWLDRIRDLGFRVKAGRDVYDRHGVFHAAYNTLSQTH
jgi:muramoyltetrapeptide carboxypeptidase